MFLLFSNTLSLTNEKLLRLPDLVHFNYEANDLLAKVFFETSHL